ncbi:unnamed protein product [Sphenostylis stenocarpa]|uniref:RING-type E3 ubiquitin transferase n=1 Tax=Sphenostylis stenocarpa TaxID=92480 RepID=A0AA86W447_9FABA|nr:unnamed protein product [Sphenostylis stenocarpa]
MSEGYSCGCSDSDSSCGCWSTAAAATTTTRSEASTELRLYRAFIFCVPIFFTLILLFLFYLFYLRPRTRLHWITHFGLPNNDDNHNGISTPDLGLNKELREMLPIIVYKESFSVKDTQCSVCLLDYQPEDRLQQIPACGHTFHMSCIDLWLATHTTCPLCRFSLLTIAKSSTQTSDMQSQNNEETQAIELSESRSTRHLETTVLQNVSGEVAISAHCIDVEGQNVQDE